MWLYDYLKHLKDAGTSAVSQNIFISIIVKQQGRLQLPLIFSQSYTLM